MVKASAEDLRFISESQRLAGFPGRITPSVVAQETNLNDLARGAQRFGAQAPDPTKRRCNSESLFASTCEIAPTSSAAAIIASSDGNGSRFAVAQEVLAHQLLIKPTEQRRHLQHVTRSRFFSPWCSGKDFNASGSGKFHVQEKSSQRKPRSVNCSSGPLVSSALLPPAFITRAALSRKH
jgi:hypothetical protein